MYSITIEGVVILFLVLDRVYRLRSIEEYQQAKDAQIAALQQQLELERRNNDTEIAELLKKRCENLKLIIGDREELAEQLLEELNAVERLNHRLQTERKMLSKE